MVVILQRTLYFLKVNLYIMIKFPLKFLAKGPVNEWSVSIVLANGLLQNKR